MRFTVLFIVFFGLICFEGGSIEQLQQKKNRQEPNAFELNKLWEIRLKEKVRSSSREVKVLSPISGANFSDDMIEFEWDGVFSKKLFLGLLNNRNKEIFYKEIAGRKFTLSGSEAKLKPGLYYWILESENETLCLGKFYFKKPK